MKEFFRSFFASLLAIIVSGFLFVMFIFMIAVGIAKSVKDKDAKPIAGSILRIDLTKRIHEIGESNPFAAFSEGDSYRAGLYDIISAIDEAKSDGSIKGIYLKLGPSPNGWATLQELQYALLDFKSSGKFIYGYGENITQGAYFVATACDSIFLNPAGDLELKGFATELTFFKGTLDKLEIQPEIFYAGKFKSATEPFRTDRMSEPNKVQVRAFQDAMWWQFTHAVSDFAGYGADTVDQLAQSGAIQFPEDALKYHLISGLRYQDQVASLLRRKAGQSEKEDIDFVNINEYANNVKSTTPHSHPRIAVLLAEGSIVDGEQGGQQEIASVTMSNEIRKLRLNDRVKAVVLRVNSPGGSALASEVILRELQLLRKKKPLIVSMGDYAASGGYYIASNADSIFALPNTITGSIGVFGMMFSIDKLMKNKLGVTFDGVKNAPYADFPTMARPLSDAEAQRMQNSINRIYAQFKGHVAEGRNLSPEIVDSIAQGRVWTGSDALEIGLVDKLGDLYQAIESAARMAKLSNYSVVTYPEATDKLSSLMKRIGNNTETKAAIKSALQEEIGIGYDWFTRLRSLQQMNGRPLAAMPFMLNVQ